MPGDDPPPRPATPGAAPSCGARRVSSAEQGPPDERRSPGSAARPERHRRAGPAELPALRSRRPERRRVTAERLRLRQRRRVDPDPDVSDQLEAPQAPVPCSLLLLLRLELHAGEAWPWLQPVLLQGQEGRRWSPLLLTPGPILPSKNSVTGNYSLFLLPFPFWFFSL